MSLRATCLLIGWAGLIAASLTAQERASILSFRYERPIDSRGSGPKRLVVDLPLLAGGRPFVVSAALGRGRDEPRYVALRGLGDLRLFDAAGREIPYLLVTPPLLAWPWIVAEVLPVATTKKTSGFEADLGRIASIDRMRITGLPAPFLKRLVMEGSGDREHWTMLAAEGTLFDLPSERLQQLEIGFAPGPYKYLRVTWDDTNSGRVPLPAFVQAQEIAADAPAASPTTLIASERRPSEPGRSRYRLRLPAPRLPLVALQIAVRNDRVLRDARVTEPRLTGSEVTPVELGRATLRRVVRDLLVAESLRIPITPPTETLIDLVVDDGNNPPLDLERVTAEFALLPWIYFESAGGSIVARFGNPRIEAPRYDLEAVRASIRPDMAAEATWGEPRELQPSDAAGMPASAPAGGAPIDVSSFSHVRAIPSGEAGLVALQLDPAILAHSQSQANFTDVRVVDASSRQVPYVLERRDEPLVVDVAIQSAKSEPSGVTRDGAHFRSTYRLSMPFAKLPSPRLVLTTSARVFSRRLSVGVERQADRRHRDTWFEPLASASWVHADQHTPAPALTIALPTFDAAELLLIVEEGDNQPLPLDGAQLLLPAYRVRFYRAQGADLRLAYGRSDLRPPRYDLALLAPQVLGVAAQEVRALDERSDRAKPAADAFVSPRVFWSVLAIAVIVLLGIIARLARRPTEQG